MIDYHRATAGTGQHTLRAGNHLFKILVITHADHDEVLLHRRLRRGRAGPATMLGNPLLRLLGGTVVDRHLMPRPGQMPSHRITHYPQSDKRHTCHELLLNLLLE